MRFFEVTVTGHRVVVNLIFYGGQLIGDFLHVIFHVKIFMELAIEIRKFLLKDLLNFLLDQLILVDRAATTAILSLIL